MSTSPIGPMQPTGIQPADQLAARDAKKPMSDGTACPAMPRDQLTQGGAPTTSVDDYRAAIESVGAATWGAAQSAEAALPSALELNPVTALGAVGAGAIFAASGGQPVSREQATAIGVHEQMQFGGKATDHVRSPYSNPDFVKTLPTQAQLNTHPTPSPVAGRSPSNAVADRTPQHTHTTYPGQRVNVGPNHTAHPASLTHSIKDSVHITPAETSTKPLHTGHAAPDLSGLTKPIGTAVHQSNAADQAAFAKQGNSITSAHSAHLTPSGTLANADKATGVEDKLSNYSLNPEHKDGKHKARVFQSALGYEQSNAQGLAGQIRKGLKEQPAAPGLIDEFGDRFGVDIPVTGPKGPATVRTGWIYEPGSDVPRMTTARVLK